MQNLSYFTNSVTKFNSDNHDCHGSLFGTGTILHDSLSLKNCIRKTNIFPYLRFRLVSFWELWHYCALSLHKLFLTLINVIFKCKCKNCWYISVSNLKLPFCCLWYPSSWVHSSSYSLRHSKLYLPILMS